MTPERWQEVRQRFQQLLGLDASAQRELLAQTGRDNPDLQRELEQLLAAHAEAESFMESPPALDDLLAAREAESSESIREQRIGPYQVVREIGRGGMGTVYLAARADGQFHKQVALKLIKRGMDTDAVIRRFKNERQILAQLEHPNIARLIDGGTSDEGLPYLVMEYIEGQRVDTYCDEHRLSVRERLDLFCEICSAVQYAHQNLVIHRDLKPSNILVTADGTPKLLDFGVAKLLTDEVSGATVESTVAGTRPMTPEFASPEQVQGQMLTTTSDVYSLGVLLYVLLTGRHPYQHHTISTSAELVRMICEQEAEKPSAAVLAIEQFDEAQNNASPATLWRRDDRQNLRRTLVGDLDNIVLRALRKDPKTRYPSAEQLSDDIRRYLQGLPVRARPSTFGYRAAKFASRHRAAISAAAIILFTLIAGLITTARQAQIARRERARADHSLADVRKLANSSLFEFHDAIANLPGSTPARILVVKRAREYLDRLASEPGAERDLALQGELAMAYEKLGKLQGLSGVANLGDTTGAMESFERAVAIRRALARAAPGDAKAQAALSVAHYLLAHVLGMRGDSTGARSHGEEAVRIAEGTYAAHPSNDEARSALIGALNSLSDVLLPSGDLQPIIEIRRRGLQLIEEEVAAAPNDPARQRALAIGCKKLGAALEQSGELLQAIELYRRALTIEQKRVSAEPNNARARLDLSYSFGSLGFALSKSGDIPQALDNYNQALALREALSRADPTNADARFAVASALGKIARIQRKAQNWQPALEAYHRAIPIFESLASADPEDVDLKINLASYSGAFGELYLEWASTAQASPVVRRNRLQEARQWLQRSRNLWLALQERTPTNALNRSELEKNTAKLAECEAALAMP